MLGGGPAHALAPELTLKPVLVELGAVCPAQGLFQLDSTYTTDESLARWTERWGRSVLDAAKAARSSKDGAN
jgi:FMN reductase